MGNFGEAVIDAGEKVLELSGTGTKELFRSLREAARGDKSVPRAIAEGLGRTVWSFALPVHREFDLGASVFNVPEREIGPLLFAKIVATASDLGTWAAAIAVGVATKSPEIGIATKMLGNVLAPHVYKGLGKFFIGDVNE